MTETIFSGVAIVLVFGVLAQWLGWRLGLPSILLLLAAGIVAGPIEGFLNPEALRGEWLLAFASISVALILYEGGLTLRFSELRGAGGVVRNLVTVGALLTWAIAGLAAHWIFGLSAALATLLGAVLVVTGPTVIGPLLRQIRPTGSAGTILKWEGIVIDPVGALLAVLVFGVVTVPEAEDATVEIAKGLARTVFSCVLGAGAAGGLVLMLKRHWVPEFLQNAVSLMLVVASFVFCNEFVQHESGFFAVTIMGIVLANQKAVDVRHIVEFKENLRVLLISTLFILLAARLKIRDLQEVWLPAIAFIAVLVLVARPLAILVSTWRSPLKRNERIFLAWMAPRGIVAAAVASVFALRFEDIEGFEQARLLVPITFATIIGTVAIYGLTAGLVARRLGVAEPDPQGVLIVGANVWARALAATLKDKGFRVLLVDSNRDHTAAARMAGLPTYSGSILAEYALDEIDLGGLGRLLAATPNDWVNILTVQRFERIFGKQNCYQTPPAIPGKGKQPEHKHLHGRWLFGDALNADELDARVGGGATVKATPLTDEFDYEQFQLLYGETAVAMMTILESGKLRVATADSAIVPKAGQTLISLVAEPGDGSGA